MNISKKELKVIGYDFRTRSSRLLQSNFDSFYNDLDRFIRYIENQSIIMEYINSYKIEGYDMKKEIDELKEAFGRAIFDIGSNEEEEVFIVYSILRYILENKISINILLGYASGSKKYDDMIKNFNNRVSLILIGHIESYITKLMIKMGYDEDVKYVINIGGNGQVNISKDSSELNAVQNNNDISELENLVSDIKQLLQKNNLDKQLIQNVEDNIDVVNEELRKDNPKKGFLRVALNGLEEALPKIKGSIELTAAITSIIQFGMLVL